MAAVEDPSRNDFFPPTSLEKSVRELGADAIRYRVDYVMLPMRDGVRLATVVVRPRAEGRFPTLGVRSPYAETSIHEPFKPLSRAQFGNGYVLVVQNERGTEWSEGEFGFLPKTTQDAQDTLGWIAAQDWSNGKETIAGDVSAVLYVSAEVEDADVFVKLVDVYPDGTAYNLYDMCLRLRYRDGLER